MTACIVCLHRVGWNCLLLLTLTLSLIHPSLHARRMGRLLHHTKTRSFNQDCSISARLGRDAGVRAINYWSDHHHHHHGSKLLSDFHSLRAFCSILHAQLWLAPDRR